jgi:hypothetical protein
VLLRYASYSLDVFEVLHAQDLRTLDNHRQRDLILYPLEFVAAECIRRPTDALTSVVPDRETSRILYYFARLATPNSHWAVP